MDKYECDYTILSQSKVDVCAFVGYVTVEMNRILRRHFTEGEVTIADDEITNILIFELLQPN